MGTLAAGAGGGGGGPLGAMGMDMGMYNMPLVGGFFQDPNKTFLQQQFQQVAKANQAYRPEQAQAHMNAMANRMSAFQGANNILARLYGGANAIDTSQMEKNPMSPNMMNVGAPQSMLHPAQSGPTGGLLGGLLGGIL